MNANRNIIYCAGFIFTLPIALTSYINSSFLENYASPYFISILYVFSSILTIIGFLELPKILTRWGNRVTTLWFSLGMALSLIFLAFGSSTFLIIPAFVLYFISSNLIIATLDIFIEDFSKSTNIGRLRGLYLMIINAAWVISQMISGSILNKSSYTGIYLISSFFMIIVAGIFLTFLGNFVDPKYKKISIKKTVAFFVKNKNVSKIYLINLILKFFFAWMVIYTPIYLHHTLGLGWSQIGIIFTIMLLPFVILSYPLGRLSDTMGEKQMLMWGFLISAIATLCIPFITTPTVWMFALVLFCTRVGAATIEVMSESYFFKSVSEENADAISFFRNTGPVSFIIAPLLAVPVLYYVPSFKYIFFVLGAIMLGGYFLVLKLRDVK